MDIIIIKGAPASGKSTTANELAKKLPSGVKIEVDTLRSMVISVDWTNQNEHIDVLNVSAHLARNFFRIRFSPIIIVDTFSGDKIKAFYEKLLSLNNDWSVFIFGLYATEDEIKKRVDKRTSDQFKDFEACRKINADILKYKHPLELQIDTTCLRASDTAKIIFETYEMNKK